MQNSLQEVCESAESLSPYAAKKVLVYIVRSSSTREDAKQSKEGVLVSHHPTRYYKVYLSEKSADFSKPRLNMISIAEGKQQDKMSILDLAVFCHLSGGEQQ